MKREEWGVIRHIVKQAEKISYNTKKSVNVRLTLKDGLKNIVVSPTRRELSHKDVVNFQRAIGLQLRGKQTIVGFSKYERIVKYNGLPVNVKYRIYQDTCVDPSVRDLILVKRGKRPTIINRDPCRDSEFRVGRDKRA